MFFKRLLFFTTLLLAACNSSPSHEKQLTPDNKDSSAALTILRIRIIENSISPFYDLNSTEINMKCRVLDVLKKEKIKTEDTIFFSHKVYLTPQEIKTDTLEKIRNTEKYRVGTEYVVYLKHRISEKMEYTDSVFTHFTGKYDTVKSKKELYILSRNDEYKLIKMVRQ
jgi:hypothetical protein